MRLRKTRPVSRYSWTCPACGLPHIIATCVDVIPFDQWGAMTKDERAVRFLESMQESLASRGLLSPGSYGAVGQDTS